MFSTTLHFDCNIGSGLLLAANQTRAIGLQPMWSQQVDIARNGYHILIMEL